MSHELAQHRAEAIVPRTVGRDHFGFQQVGLADEVGDELVGGLLVDVARRADCTIRPLFITAISCDSASASVWSWVT